MNSVPRPADWSGPVDDGTVRETAEVTESEPACA
jgi:hypothetical protein